MDSQKDVWNALLTLRRFEKNEKQVIGWSFFNQKIQCHYSDTSLFSVKASALLVRTNLVNSCQRSGWKSIKLPFEDLKLIYDTSLSTDIVDMLSLYCPLSVMHFYKRKKPFVFVHVAASLDGKMATHSGDSKWIGNQENLVHSHRLRALVDGILVGACTVKNDQPSLNVRHVEGENPIRLIVSNHSKDFSGLQQIDDVKTFLIREESFRREEKYDCFDDIIYYTAENKEKKIGDLLERIYDKGIKSILIEGGSETISNIFQSGGIDVFQVHYAPIIIGSGKSIAELPLIDRIADASFFKNSFWTKIGDTFMITAGL